MEKKYNDTLLYHEAQGEKIEQELMKLLEKRIKTQISEQMDIVCRIMEERLIESWENGGFGEELACEIHIKLLDETLSYTYKDLANSIVRSELRAYGFNAYYNAHLREKDGIAHVYFNFTNSFYGEENNWCSKVAKAYLRSKVTQTVSMLWKYIDSKCASMRSQLVKESYCKTNIAITVKLPPAAREIVADNVVKAMPTVLEDYTLEGQEQIVFNLLFPLM